ncbi:MAG: hydroxypyruvate isomerase family protein [Janthinobacterium lividum]
MTLKQSFCWWGFAGHGVPDLELLQKAKAIGYEAVEQLGEELFQPARDLGFVIAAQSGHQSIDRGWNDLHEHPRLESEIHASLALAQKYQIPNLIVFSGNRSACPSDEIGLDNTATGLARIAGAAEDAGVTLTLELLNSKRDHGGYQCDHTSWGVEVCRRVASPRVKLLYDIYHMQIMEGDIISTIEANHSEFGHYHTAGVPGRHDLDETQELNYPPIMRAIAKTGYTGFVGHEFTPKGDPIAALGAAFRLCDV